MPYVCMQRVRLNTRCVLVYSQSLLTSQSKKFYFTFVPVGTIIFPVSSAIIASCYFPLHFPPPFRKLLVICCWQKRFFSQDNTFKWIKNYQLSTSKLIWCTWDFCCWVRDGCNFGISFLIFSSLLPIDYFLMDKYILKNKRKEPIFLKFHRSYARLAPTNHKRSINNTSIFNCSYAIKFVSGVDNYKCIFVGFRHCLATVVENINTAYFCIY